MQKVAVLPYWALNRADDGMTPGSACCAGDGNQSWIVDAAIVPSRVQPDEYGPPASLHRSHIRQPDRDDPGPSSAQFIRLGNWTSENRCQGNSESVSL
jgi:hypothetical protein